MKIGYVPVVVFAFAMSFSAPSAVLAQSVKHSPPRTIPVKKVFPFYDLYLNLPPEGRDGFRIDYQLASGTSAARPRMDYVLGTTRTPIDIASDGRIVNLPDLAMLNYGRIDIPANQPRTSIALNLKPIIPLSRLINASAATNSLADYEAAIRRAGPVAALAPNLTTIIFKGGSGGEAVFSDGRRVGLSAAPGGVKFQPNARNMQGVVGLSFASAPNQTEFAK